MSHSHSDSSDHDDSTVQYTDLHAFQRDLLLAIAAHEDTPYGTALVEALEERYGELINHSRVYQNLNALVEDGVLDKRAIDDRANAYELTDTGVVLLDAQSRRMQQALAKISDENPDGVDAPIPEHASSTPGGFQ